MFSEKISDLKQWWLIHKRLPKTDRLNILDPVDGDEVFIANEIVVETNHLVKVLDKQIAPLS